MTTAALASPTALSTPRRVAYDQSATLRQARAQYFETFGFGPETYTARFAKFQVGPIPIWVPNIEARRLAVRLHDLHHVVTGYRADWHGEFEISAWELGAGCGKNLFAWHINSGGAAVGALVSPGRTLRAFARGRRSRTLYAAGVDPKDEAFLDDTTVQALRQRLHIVDDVEPTAADRAAFVAAAAASLLYNVGPLVAVMALALWALVF